MLIAKRQIIHSVGILLLAIWMLSCSTERKLATGFVKTNGESSTLVFYPDFLFKTNQKTFLLDSLGIMDESLFDSVLMAHSKFLQHTNDSLFIANYVLGFSKELSAFGFAVYEEDEIAEFMELDTNSFVINVAQLELEESIYTHRDESLVYDTYYYHDQDLEAIYVNAWIEISRVDENLEKPNVYFATAMVSDDFDGDFSFDIFSGNIRYIYNIDSLDQADIYKYAYELGRTYASYTFDFLLNTYLDNNLPKGERSDKYWRYNPYDKTFFPAYEDRLIPLND